MVFFRASISSYGGDHQNTSAARSRGYHIPSKNVQVITIQDKETLQRFANATAQNVTFLLDHLLQQYDNSLRPDISGIFTVKYKKNVTSYENITRILYNAFYWKMF